MGQVRETFSPVVNTEFQRVIQSKEAERRRSRELPWLEKLELLDKLRERQVLLGNMKPGRSKLLERKTAAAE